METLTIRAASVESARGFCAALEDFRAALVEDPQGTFLVTVAFNGGNREILSVLRALEECVSQRADGPAVVGLNGKTYTLHATDPAVPGAVDYPNPYASDGGSEPTRV